MATDMTRGTRFRSANGMARLTYRHKEEFLEYV
jgi:hypothetical protein